MKRFLQIELQKIKNTIEIHSNRILMWRTLSANLKTKYKPISTVKCLKKKKEVKA